MPELIAIIEAVLLAAGEPLSLERLSGVFPEAERPEREVLRTALSELAIACAGRGVELVEVAGGFRLQVPQAFSPWVSRLWEERAAHYSRALLETLALIAYRQPITRGEIEAVRGVSLSSSIMKTLQERDWIKVVGHREVPGRPALYATTHTFLDYFNLKSLSDLPPLVAAREPEIIGAEVDLHAQANPPALSGDTRMESSS
ncbi:chromosome condensation and segregation factor [Candidatus Competibacter denitrificans Run_A_D11]|uniref:Chromosome condensation and segregation factor n=1 Tax=Candidatus Competibacter denitrificans Run_A_D11 TaxID=1400863 RepID=W6MD19_9GAMM|nr:chromosome condensation and segregation factor [Candidatus Competibacter denitrificans Run_A_D11]HAS85630.1 SMC-Scp complex subunit ScpB [Candidatus Competibacteraceae bacterium]